MKLIEYKVPVIEQSRDGVGISLASRRVLFGVQSETTYEYVLIFLEVQLKLRWVWQI